MKKFFTIFSISLAIILGLLYLTFLIAPPIFNAVYDLDKHKKDIQKIVKNSAKLNLDYSKIKIYSTPLLSIGAIIEDINVTLDDKSSVFKAQKIKGGIALPSLLTLTIKTAKTEIINPYVNLEILDDKQYKILSIIEDIINENNAKPKAPAAEQNELVEKIVKNIKIKIPAIKIVNFEALINDLKTSHNLKLNSEELIVGYNSANNSIKIKTNAKLLSDNKENILASINVKAQLPKPQPATEAKDPEEKIALPFVNIVKIYQTYDLKANIDSKLRIKNSQKGFISFGYFNIDDINLKLSDIRLPNSYIHAKTHGKKVIFDSNLYAKDNEKIALIGELKYGKKPRIKTQILSDKIHFTNLIDLLAGLLDSLNIKNELKQIKTTGYLIADASIKTNFKKLKSQGSIIVKDGSFINPKNNIGIKDIVVNLILDNNILNIKDTSLSINNSKLNAKGSIDTKSNADIKLNIDNLSLSELYSAFAPKELKNSIVLNKAHLTTNVDIKGKLDNLNANLDAKLNNLNLSDPKKTMIVSNDNLNINFSATPTAINGKIANNNFKINLPQLKTIGKIDKLNVALDSENIQISPFDFTYNDLSKINVKGNILNYTKNPNIDIFADAKISTKNLNETLGKEIAHFIPSKGIIPAKVSIKGDLSKQEILAQIYADNNNFITPINLNSLVGGQSIAQADIKIHKNKINIKNSGLFKVQNGFNNDLEANMLNAQRIAELTTILDNGHINLFRINIPEVQSGQIGIFKNSKFNTKGKITLNGSFDDLSFGGDLKVSNVDIPEILFKTELIDLDFISNGLNLKTKNIDINGSKIDAGLKADLKPADVFKISDIEVKSGILNVDSALVVLDKLMKYMPPAPATSNKNAAPADIPLAADGKFDIKKLTTGNMVIRNIKGDLGIKNNNLTIKNLNCDAFDGKVDGDIKMNLLSSLLTIKLNGKGLNADKAASDAANLKNTISGTMNFKTDISLKGATYEEQMKSLKGDVTFNLKDGQYGPFAKLENFFLAENIRENAFFKNTIGVVLTPITTIDSSHYETLEGKVSFNNGVVNLGSIKSQGDILCVLVNGNMNLLTNDLNSKVRVRLASTVSDMLGPIAMANPINLVKNTPGLNIASAKLFSVFSEVVEESEYKEIPDFAKDHSDANATKFQVVLDGSVLKPLSLVKSFKWLVLQEDMDKATEFSANFVQEELIKQLQNDYEQNHKIKVGLEKILQMDTTAPEVKKILEQEAAKKKEQAVQSVQQAVEVKKEETKKELEAKAKELEQKVQQKQEENAKKLQEAIELKKQEQEQKLLDAQNALKLKLQEKLKIPTTTNTQQETQETN